MTLRASEQTVTFHRPFTLETSGEVLPPGEYVIETVEESLENVSFLAYRRILTLLHMPSLLPNTPMARSLEIQPGSLDAALERDAALLEASPSNDHDRKPGNSAKGRRSKKTSKTAADGQSAIRAEAVAGAQITDKTGPRHRQRKLEQQRPFRNAPGGGRQ